jgi:hypothetical protein
MSSILHQFRKEAKALDRNYNSINELRMWAVAKIAEGSAVIVVHDSQSGQVIGIIKTDSREKALETLAEYLEPEDTTEALEWLQGHTKLEIFQILEPNRCEKTIAF